MYIYNVTLNIEESIQQEWLKWMKEVYIPEMLGTGKFTKALMTKVLVKEDMGGITYSIQYTTDTKETLCKYYEDNEVEMRKKINNRFASKFVSFETELEIVSEHNS